MKMLPRAIMVGAIGLTSTICPAGADAVGNHHAGETGGLMTNGQYSVTSSFWALPQAVQSEGAPTLNIVPATPGYATISWTPATGTHWVLQETLGLSAPAWNNSSSGWTNPVVVPATLPVKFYRLFKP